MEKKQARSNHYQPYLLEISYSPDVLTDFSDQKGIAGTLNASQYNEELKEFREQLLINLWRIIDTKLTSRQKEILHLHAQDLTQIEIAKSLGVNQSSITKSMHGNCDYKNGKKVYGGALKKLRKLALEDSKIIKILNEIRESSE